MAKSNATGRGFGLRVRHADGTLRDSARPLLKELLLEDRFFKEGDECWYWRGGHKSGRPWTRLTGENTQVARAAYEVWFERCPKGRYVCHRCDNGACWNPAHLYAGTPKQNAQDRVRAEIANGIIHPYRKKTHCPQGHIYDAENTTWYQGRRYCRACHKAYSLAYSRKVQGVKNPRV